MARVAVRWLVFAAAALLAVAQVVYAATGGLHPSPVIRAAYIGMGVVGALLCFPAPRFRWLPLLGLVLLTVPVLLSMPEPLASGGGLAYIVVLAIGWVLGVLSLRQPAHNASAP